MNQRNNTWFPEEEKQELKDEIHHPNEKQE